MTCVDWVIARRGYGVIKLDWRLNSQVSSLPVTKCNLRLHPIEEEDSPPPGFHGAGLVSQSSGKSSCTVQLRGKVQVQGRLAQAKLEITGRSCVF